MRVYRFRDKVAINPPDGPTFYILASEAYKLAEALETCAEDIARLNFADSEVGTIGIETTEEA